MLTAFRRRGQGWAALAGFLGALTLAPPGLAQAPSAPPAPRVESPSPSPGPDSVWISGHWGWQSGRWQWVAGRWERAQGRFYIPGRHRQTPQGWVWEEGRWQK
jgi:hypothetical protein